MQKFQRRQFLFYLLHILHVFIHKVSFIFFNTSFFVYFYTKRFDNINYVTIFLFLIPSLIYHIIEMIFIQMTYTNSLIEEIEYIVFICFYLFVTSRFVDWFFQTSPLIFSFLISIQSILSAKIGVFYNYSFYEQCFNEKLFHNRILLMIFEGLPVYFAALYMTYAEIYNSFKPYFYLCILLYLSTGIVQIFNLKDNKKIKVIEDCEEKKLRSISFLSVICRANEIFLYLVLTARTENISTVVFYFSIDFMFRLCPFKLPNNIFCYLIKFLITVSTFYFIIDQSLIHIYFSLLIFLINGFSNQMVYNSVQNTLMEQTVENFLVFTVFSIFLPFFAKKYCLKDFVFFNDVKL